MKKVKVYLSNTNAVTYPVVRKGLIEVLSKIEYTNNFRAADHTIDCTYLTKEKMCLAKNELLKEINDKHKRLNILR
jgi:hypothetical protein